MTFIAVWLHSVLIEDTLLAPEWTRPTLRDHHSRVVSFESLFLIHLFVEVFHIIVKSLLTVSRWAIRKAVTIVFAFN